MKQTTIHLNVGSDPNHCAFHQSRQYHKAVRLKAYKEGGEVWSSAQSPLCVLELSTEPSVCIGAQHRALCGYWSSAQSPLWVLELSTEPSVGIGAQHRALCVYWSSAQSPLCALDLSTEPSVCIGAQHRALYVYWSSAQSPLCARMKKYSWNLSTKLQQEQVKPKAKHMKG